MNVMHMEYMQEALGRIKSKMAINAQMNLGDEWDYALLYPRVQGLVTISNYYCAYFFLRVLAHLESGQL